MAKKVILKDLKGTEVLPITRGELVIDSSGKQALHSNEFLATTSLPGLMSASDKNKLDNFQGDTYELSGVISDDKYITTLTSSKGVTTNAVIEPMQGATVDLAGKVGLVPAVGAGGQNKFLRGDGTWVHVAGGASPDTELDTESGNAVENRVIANKINEILQLILTTTQNLYWADQPVTSESSTVSVPTFGGANINGHVQVGNESTTSQYLLSVQRNKEKLSLLISGAKEGWLLQNYESGKSTALILNETNLIYKNNLDLYWTVYHSGNLTNVSQLNNDIGYVTGGPYLPLSGGTISNAEWGESLIVKRESSNGNSVIRFINSKGELGHIGIGGNEPYNPIFTDKNRADHIIIHSGNIGSQSVGNASTADKLKNKVKLWGLDFDGSKDIDGTLTGVVGIKTSEENNGGRIYVNGNSYTGALTVKDLAIIGDKIALVGNVGIGTTNPSSKLEVAGTITATDTFTLSKSLTGGTSGILMDCDMVSGVRRSYICLDPTHPFASGLDYVHIAAFSDGRAYFDIPRDGTLLIANTIHASDGGNVGIGTTSPVSKLDIIGSNGWTCASTSNNSRVALAHNDGYGLAITSKTTSSSLYLLSVSYGQSSLGSGGYTALHVRGDGNVGIGTISPEYKLHTDGKIASTSSQNTVQLIPDADCGLYMTSSGQWIHIAGSGREMYIYNGTWDKKGTGNYNKGITISTTNNIGIGNASPAHKLDVNGTAKATSLMSSNIRIECDNNGVLGQRGSEINNYNGHLYLNHHSSTNIIMAMGGGNTGIGTNSPKAKLDVNGNTKVSGSVYINSVELAYSSSALAVYTPSGKSWFGMMNEDYCHIYTDAPAFYFNKSSVYANGYLIWHSGNDGSGSGLDADLLDGKHASAFQLAGNYLIDHGMSTSRPDGRTFTLPGGVNGVSMRSKAPSGADIGIFQLTDDNAFICNSSDVGYLFATFDTDQTADFSSSSNAAFAVLSNHAGVSMKGNLTVAGSVYLNNSASNRIAGLHLDSSFEELTHINKHGYISIGPFNTGHAHIYTDRSNFYFNAPLMVNGTAVSLNGHTHSYLPLSGGWMDWNAGIHFKGYNGSTSVYGRIGYATSASSQTMHCINTAGNLANGALYITSNGSTSANDTGGLAIDNEGVTVFGAGDAGSNFTGVFRVLNEDNVADGPQFIVTKASGATVKYNMYAAHFYENSDAKLKENIQAILNKDNIPQIKEFDWKESGEHSYGLIAQELEEQGYSELVSTKDDGYKTVNYSAALSLIVGKLQVKIKELEEEIENLKSKN